MLRTFGNTLSLLGTSWRVLRNDGLVMFPLALGVSLLIVLFYMLLAFQYGGTFDRVVHGFDVLPADFIFLCLSYLGGSFVIAYFTAALVAAEHYRTVGGTPDFRMGLEAANDRLGAIALWALIVSTAGVALKRIAPGVPRHSANLFGALVWGGATLLVTPVMMVEGSPPLEAMRRSAGIFTETWGRQLAGNFGFGVLYVLLLAAALGLGGGLYMLGVPVTIAVFTSVVLFALLAATVKCLESVFIVALYNYACLGEPDGSFAEEVLRDAYVFKKARGRFRPPPTRRRAAA
jgi:hypothetical protein